MPVPARLLLRCWPQVMAGVMAGVLAGVVASPLACGPAPQRPPDVLLVVIDTLRADRTTVLDADLPMTPNLAELGRAGIVYTQAVASSSWTVPSIAALFSGREVTANRYDAYPDTPALAERFAAAGYRTHAVVGNPLISRESGFDRGFEMMEIALEGTWDGVDPDHDVHEQNAAGRELVAAWNAGVLVDLARAALRDSDDRPLFLYLQLMDVHTPRDPGHVARVPRLPGWSMGATRGSFPRVYWTTEMSAEQGRRVCNLRRLYDAQIAYVDEALAPLIEDVRSRGGLVAVTSDHGEGLFTRRRDPDGHPSAGYLAPAEANHGYQRTEEALRVPIWLAGPGVPVGRRETRPVAMRDLGETLASLAGLPGSLSRLPLSGHDASPAVILGTDRRGWFVRTADRKLLMPFPARMADPAIRPTLVAVTAASYAAELKDLAADEPEQLSALLQALEDWRAAHPDEDAEDVDALTLERLEALGYLR